MFCAGSFVASHNGYPSHLIKYFSCVKNEVALYRGSHFELVRHRRYYLYNSKKTIEPLAELRSEALAHFQSDVLSGEQNVVTWGKLCIAAIKISILPLSLL